MQLEINEIIENFLQKQLQVLNLTEIRVNWNSLKKGLI